MFASIRQCLGMDAYRESYKKHDDFPLEKTKQWVQRNPVDQFPAVTRRSEIEKLVSQLISDLGTFEINATNINSIQDHLYLIANKSEGLRSCLVEKLREKHLNCEQDLKERLMLSIIFFVPCKPSC